MIGNRLEEIKKMKSAKPQVKCVDSNCPGAKGNCRGRSQQTPKGLRLVRAQGLACEMCMGAKTNGKRQAQTVVE